MGASLLAAGATASAQSDVGRLTQRLDRLERDMSLLQQQLARQKGVPSPTAVQEGAGIAARLDQRLSDMEAVLTELTGRVERVAHDVGVLKVRLDKLSDDVDFRLKGLEQATPAPGAAPGQTGSAAPGKPAPGSGPAPAPAGEGQLALGQGAGATLPGGSAEEQYKYAVSLVREVQVAPSEAQADEAAGRAEQALRAFIEGHPGNDKLSNAHYWLGETYYFRKNYKQAAITFLDAYQKYPKGPKAPDSLLKLGLSLDGLGKKKEACDALAQLGTQYPDAAAPLKRAAKVQQDKLGCK